MATETDMQTYGRWTRRFALVGLALFACGLLLLPTVMLLPVEPSVQSVAAAKRTHFRPVRQPEIRLQPLLWKMTGNWLFRRSQVSAAVKDTGAAQRLIRRLELQGISRVGEGMVAYILVDGKRPVTVRRGENVLEFVVSAIEQGKVTLSLQGVEAVLVY